MRAQIIGRLPVDAREWLRNWVTKQPHKEVTKSSYVRGRTEGWYRLGSNLQSIPCGRAALFAAPEPPERLAAFGDRHVPGWHSLLVCGGTTSITPHCDHGHFCNEAVMINLGEAVFVEHVGTASESLTLRDGDVVRLDIKVTHSAQQTSSERFNFCFRQVKREFLGGEAMRQPSLFDAVS